MKKRDFDESFPSNYLTNVASEIKYPVLLKIQEKVPDFQEKIREKLPNFGMSFSVPVERITSLPFELSEWVFESIDKKVHLKLAPNRMALIVNEYSSYKLFKSEFIDYINKLSITTGISVFTRLGIRYTNEYNIKDNIVDELVDLFNPLVDSNRIKNNKPISFNFEYRYKIDQTDLTIRNELIHDESGFNKYIIDIDSYTVRTIKLKEVEKILDELHTSVTKEFHENIKDKFIDLLRVN